jgi:hypothetical protein
MVRAVDYQGWVMGGIWGSFTPPASVGSFNADTMLLLTDGSVLIHDAFGPNWLRLTPDGQGNYPTGTWSGPLPMSTMREDFASGILPDGRVYVVGGEYSGVSANAPSDSPSGEIFDPDPAKNAWGPLVKPPEFDFIQGDASSCVLADGLVLFGNLGQWSPPFKTALWDPVSGDWSVAGSGFGALTQDTKVSNCNEETWTLLPDGSVLTVDTFDVPHAERYVPSIDQWVPAGETLNSLVLQTITDPMGAEIVIFEIGPAILLPGGQVFAIGATGQTGLYTPPPAGSHPRTTPGIWFPGPHFPPDTSTGAVYPTLTASDAPAVLQTNGKVLLVAGSLYETKPGTPGADYFSQHTTLLEFDPAAGTIFPFAPVPFEPANGPVTYVAHFLLLPTGQILLSTETSLIYIFTPDAATHTPEAAWRPVITSCATTLVTGSSYTITGTQLNGLSQAVSYGDDAQMATNYPLVRLSNDVGDVRYLPTSNFSTMGVATGAEPVTAQFLVSGADPGPWQLQVIANGIASEPALAVEVTVSGSQQCIGLYDGILQRWEHHEPPVTPAEHTEIAQQLALCYREGNLTEAQYESALRMLNEINEVVPPHPGPPFPPPL